MTKGEESGLGLKPKLVMPCSVDHFKSLAYHLAEKGDVIAARDAIEGAISRDLGPPEA